MALLRVLHGMLRIVICGGQTVDADGLEEVMEIELEVEDEEKSVACFTDASFEGLARELELETEFEANLPRIVSPRDIAATKLTRVDSLERGFQNVMLKAKTFACKWSQPDVRNELLVATPEPSSPNSELQEEHCGKLVCRDSSQARFELLMQRTSRFYQRYSSLQRQPDLEV